MDPKTLNTHTPEKRIISRATTTTIQADESRLVVTTNTYEDGTQEIIEEILLPKGEHLPVGPSNRLLQEEEGEEVGGYLPASKYSTTTSPLSEVIIDSNQDDVSIMESLFEHPILLDVESQSLYQEVVIKPAQDPLPQQPVLNSSSSGTQGVSPNTSGADDFSPSVKKYNDDRRCENKWLVLAILILGIAGVGTAIGVMVGLQSYRNKVSNNAINEQIGATPDQSQIPTAEPSEIPTSFPSMSPSLPDVTLSPSKVISEMPSPLPTKSPSEFPTLDPTMLPTPTPTYNPTDFPSSFPTQSPVTPAPSLAPVTASPSLSPVTPSLAPVMATSQPVSITTGAPDFAASNSSVFQNRPVASPVSGACKDSIGWVDKNNQGCSTYEANGCSLAFIQANNVGVGAKRACCACGGGNRDYVTTANSDTCRDYFGFVDNSNDSCDWYLQNDRCGFADTYTNLVGVSAKDACCGCGGGYKI
jgi:hypothetical protein